MAQQGSWDAFCALVPSCLRLEQLCINQQIDISPVLARLRLCNCGIDHRIQVMEHCGVIGTSSYYSHLKQPTTCSILSLPDLQQSLYVHASRRGMEWLCSPAQNTKSHISEGPAAEYILAATTVPLQYSTPSCLCYPPLAGLTVHFPRSGHCSGRYRN